MKKQPRKRNTGSRPLRRPPRFSRELAILYEDGAVIAVDKPAGLLAVPIPGSDSPSALSLVAQHLKPRHQSALIVHRIDRFASGVLLFVKTARDRDSLIKQFLAHTPVRQYLAVVRGHVAAKDGTLVHYFRKEGMHQKLSTERDRTAARAEMSYSVERYLRGATLARVALATGLQNQIRVQFAALGHPVIGDRKYSPDEATESRIARVALHAAQLQFTHPRTKEIITVECPPPPDFESLVKALSSPPRTSH